MDAHASVEGIEVGSRWERERAGMTQIIFVTRVDPPFEVRWADEDHSGIPGAGTMFASTLREKFTPVRVPELGCDCNPREATLNDDFDVVCAECGALLEKTGATG